MSSTHNVSLVRFRYTSDEDAVKARQWNPQNIAFLEGQPYLDTSEFNQNNPNNYVVLFNAKLEPSFTIPWLGQQQNKNLAILLIHYDPFKKIKQQLPHGQLIKNLLELNKGLPEQYWKDIKTFKEEMQEVGTKLGIEIENMGEKADLIVCCWGEFLERPYQQKHIYQGKSFGEVFIYNQSSKNIGVQGRHQY
jgi:hypothetical protein